VHHRTIQINRQPDAEIFQFIILTAEHVSGVFPPIIRSSITAVAASGFTFVPWWPDHEHSTTITTIRR